MKYDEIDNPLLFKPEEVEEKRKLFDVGTWPGPKDTLLPTVKYLLAEVCYLREKVELLESVAYLTDGKSTLKIVNLGE